MTTAELTAYLHEHIPITRSLGARVEHMDGRSVRLVAPLAPNLNHRATAFGGSLSMLAILSGWALLHVQLLDRDLAGRIVIQRSAFDYQAPIDGEFVATTSLPAPEAWTRFLATLTRHHAARVVVHAEVTCGAVLGGRHEGTYAVLRG